MSIITPVLVPTQASARAAYSLPEPHLPKANLSATPDASDADLISRVTQLLSYARDFRAPLVPRWRQDYRMLFNRFWRADRPNWMPSPQVPEIYPIIRAYVGFMLDQRITATIAPYAVPITPFAEYLNELGDDLEVVLESNFQANREEREWGLIVQDALVYGVGIGKTAWETDLAGGLGDAMTRRCNPFNLYVDPTATTEHDADFFIELRKMSVQELDRRWPGAADSFINGAVTDIESPPSLLDYGTNSNSSTPFLNPSAGITPSTSAFYPSTVQGSSSSRIANISMPAVTVIEAWIKEHHFVEIEDTRTGEKAKYPRITWRCVVIAGNNVLMNCPATDLWAHGQHPYCRYVWDDKGEFYGPSMVELLTSSQNMVNRLLAALQQNVELTGNPVWKDTPRSNTARQPITNKPGTRITVSEGPGGQASGWVNPPQLQQGMMQLLQYHLGRMEAISGITAMQKGNTPGGRPAQGVVESVQEAAFVTIRQAQRQLEYAMGTAANKRADLIIENYTGPRIVSIAGPGGETSALALKARHFQIPTAEGAIPMKYQLLIDAGSRSHTARVMVQGQAMQAFATGLIDRLACLQAMEWPDAANVAKRAEAAAAAQAQAAGPNARTSAGRLS